MGVDTTDNICILRPMSSYIVKTEKGVWGKVVQYPTGWRFLPWTDAHKRSRKAWPTAEAAVPRYVGKPFDLVQCAK
jgi:hypothetical protein